MSQEKFCRLRVELVFKEVGMVSIARYNKKFWDVRCLSTDAKPTLKVPNGSSCSEMDTGKGYLFDATNSTWHEIPSGSPIVIPSATGVNF